MHSSRYGTHAAGATAPTRVRAAGNGKAKAWGIATLIAVLISLFGVLPGTAIAPGGWPTFERFWLAALAPDLSGSYLLRVLDATLTTMAFSVLGTVLAVMLGLAGGVVMSEGWFKHRTSWLTTRIALSLPRGVHETVWAIALLIILGRDPLVGVLALALPFGAITAKVYAEIIDETPSAPANVLRLAGAGKLAAFVYGTLPRIWPDLLAYAFYRLDCALRSAVILGMLGVGGLGFELTTAFQGLAFDRMWSVIYALLIIGVVCELWSKKLRTASTRTLVLSAFIGAVLTILSALHLRLSFLDLDLVKVSSRLARLINDSLPPTLPSTWGALARDTLLTLHISIAAIALSTALGFLFALFACPAPGAGPLRGMIGSLTRGFLLLLRVTSPPVWALLLLFLLFPGPMPGVLALGIYNAGVLGRLFTETLDTIDRRPSLALRHAGASRLGEFFYGVLPLSRGRFAAYSLYRWEVTIRETVVVGVVGAGGLGRVLEAERTAFDYSSMLSVIITLVVLSIVVDLVSAAARRAWR